MPSKTTRTTKAKFTPRDIYGAARIMRQLRDKVDLSTMSDDELEELACHVEISNILGNLAEMMMGVGCLIANDDRKPIKSGSLQTPDQIAEMLWAFSDLIGTNVEAISIASEARYCLGVRAANTEGATA
jgi:hypothetical protein